MVPGLTIKLCILSTQSVALLRMFLTKNAEFFHEKHSRVGLCNGEAVCRLG
jgi:hypothetical protein